MGKHLLSMFESFNLTPRITKGNEREILRSMTCASGQIAISLNFIRQTGREQV